MSRFEKNAELEKICGKKIISIGRAADLVWIQFGEKIVIKDYRGNDCEKREYAIHLQCPWRILQNEKIILGSRDIFIPYEGVAESEFNWDIRGMSLFDNKVERINSESLNVKVNHIKVDSAGGIKIICENGIIFEAIPDSGELLEFWRFIDFKNKEHTVFFE